MLNSIGDYLFYRFGSIEHFLGYLENEGFKSKSEEWRKMVTEFCDPLTKEFLALLSDVYGVSKYTIVYVALAMYCCSVVTKQGEIEFTENVPSEDEVYEQFGSYVRSGFVQKIRLIKTRNELNEEKHLFCFILGHFFVSWITSNPELAKEKIHFGIGKRMYALESLD
jgi:hypothetical protein